MRKLIFLIVVITVAMVPSAVLAQLYADIGSGTATNGTSVSSPVNIFYRRTVCQFVYTASELTSAGMSPLSIIESLGWYVTNPPIYDIPGYEIKLKHTTQSDVSSALGTTGWTTVVNAFTYSPVAGDYDMIPFDQTFVWNGTDNIGVEVCWEQVQPTYNSSGQCRIYTQTNGYLFTRTDAAGTSCGDIPSTISTNKPQVRLAYQPTSGETFDLTMLSPVGEGSVSPSVGVHTYPENFEATLSASPHFGYDFEEWIGDVADPYSPITTILMDENKTVQAVFEPLPPEPLPHTSTFEIDIDGWEICSGWTRSDFSGVTSLPTMPCEGSYGMYYPGIFATGTYSIFSKTYDISNCAAANQDVNLSFCYEMTRGWTDGSILVLVSCGWPADYCNPANYDVVSVFGVTSSTPSISGTASLNLGELLVNCPLCETEGSLTIAFAIENVTAGNTAGIDEITVSCGDACLDIYTMQMLSPDGNGYGRVTPGVGFHNYIADITIDLIAEPYAGSEFDYWEIDGVWFSDNPTETLVMNDDYQVQAFFVNINTIMFEDFSVDPPGWVFDPNGWEWGPATASTGCSGGQDPDYDSTGDGNIIGYNIGGCYFNNMSVTEWATSPVWDLSGYVNIHLGFDRWLGVESSSWDRAFVEVFDGTTWHTIWENTTTLYDGAWLTQEYDISGFADNNPDFQIRFGMGPTDGSIAYCGWNIDALVITGFEPGYISGIVTSDGGTNPVIGATINVDGTTYSAISEAPDGAYLLAVPEGLYDLTVTAPGYNELTVTDIVVTVGDTTFQDFDLTYPVLNVSPLNYEKWQDTDVIDVVFDAILIENTGTGPLSWVSSTKAVSGRQNKNVLIAVHIDNNTGFWNPAAAYSAAVTSAGWNVAATVSAPASGTIPFPDPFTADEYDVVIVLTSENWWLDPQNLRLADEAAIQAYQNSGGNVLLVGQDVLQSNHSSWGNASGWFNTHLGLQSVVQDPMWNLPSGNVTGVVGTFAEGLNFIINGSDQGGPFLANNLYPDDLTPGSDSYVIWNLSDGIDTIAAAIAFEGDNTRAVFSTAELAAAASMSDFHDAIAAILEFLGSEPITWLEVSPEFGTIPPGDTVHLDLIFDSTDLPQDSYHALLTISSNAGNADVEIILHVTGLPPTPNNCQAFPDVVCAGDNVELTADSDFEIYWYDDECGGNLVGFGSLLTVNPMVTTTYFARAYDPVEDEWSDDCCDVTVIVNPSPSCLIAGPSWVDEGDTDVVYSVAEHPTATYLWTVVNAVITNGDGTHQITIDVTGLEGEVIEIDVEVNLDGCICEGSRTISIGIPPIPTTGPLGIGLLLLAIGGLIKIAKRK